MRLFIYLSFFSLIILTVIYGDNTHEEETPIFHPHHHNNDDGSDDPDIPIPFPQCFKTASAPAFLQHKVIDHIFDMKLKEEERKLTQERDRNINLNNGMFLNSMSYFFF